MSIGDERWSAVREEVRQAAEEIAHAGKFDDAIFAAFRVVEAAIQQRSGSKNVGMALLDEAFNGSPPRIDIVDDARDHEAIKNLFAGALGHIRNDRGHKREPSLPCPDEAVCLQHLSFASLLLYFLDRDRQAAPKVDATRIAGSIDQPRVELRGTNLHHVLSVLAGDVAASIVRESESVLEVLLPPEFAGVLKLEGKYGIVQEIYCDSAPLESDEESVYEIIAADVPLYSDKDCSTLRPDVVGILLLISETGGKPYTRVSPTARGKYKTGQYVSHGPFEDRGVDETWYRDPRSGQVRYAWTSSLIAKPIILGEKGQFRYGGIRAFPSVIHTEVGENRTLRVRAYSTDGPARKNEDITNLVQWKSLDDSVAYVKSGIIYPKRFGSTTLEANWQGMLSSVRVEVAHLSPGEKTIYYQGLRHLQQIRFDSEDNLYIVNQTPSVFRLNRSGGLDEVVRVVVDDAFPSGFDRVCVGPDRTLIASMPYKERCLRFRWNGKSYGPPEMIGASEKGTKKSIVVAQDGTAFIASMNGYIIRVLPDGSETAFRTRDMAINLAIGPDDLLYTTSTKEHEIHVYTQAGEFVGPIPYEIHDSPADLLVDPTGTIFIPFFRSGKLLRISTGELTQVEFIADGLGTPGGIAMDSRGRIYVSDFSGDAIHLLNGPSHS